jgi:hypothetical protein
MNHTVVPTAWQTRRLCFASSELEFTARAQGCADSFCAKRTFSSDHIPPLAVSYVEISTRVPQRTLAFWLASFLGFRQNRAANVSQESYHLKLGGRPAGHDTARTTALDFSPPPPGNFRALHATLDAVYVDVT